MDSFSNFDIGIIILVVTLFVGFLIYMILRLIDIFSSSKDLKHEREKMEIEMMKAQKEYYQKAKDKKKKLHEQKITDSDKQKPNTDKIISDEESKIEIETNIDDKDEDSFSDIEKDNIVKF